LRAKTEEDDVSLILRMSCKDSDPVDAEAALVIFFRRHHQLLKGFAEKNKYRSLGFDPEDFTIRAFHKAFEKAGTFDAPSGLTPERLLKKVQAWLFEIAKNEFLMEFRKGLNQSEETRDPDLLRPPDQGDIGEDEPDDCSKRATGQLGEHMPPPDQDSFEPVLKGKAAAVRTFLDGLSDGERQLLETSMNFFDYKANKVLIPEDILRGLANALATTPEGIKQKRKRLLQKLKEHLESSNTQDH
jgi:RNA polymerase sigma factor (sigma-70 family)